MYNRIEELAKNAGMEDYPIEGVPTLYGEAAIHKFAELIVKECVASIQKYKESDLPSQIVGGLNLSQNIIIEHFGLK